MEGHPVKCICMDNAGENKSFREAAIKYVDGEKNIYGDIVWEFTAPGTPMQNGVVERAFPTLMG
jgi:hypothetical protein